MTDPFAPPDPNDPRPSPPGWGAPHVWGDAPAAGVRPTNPWAIVALVTGVVALFPIAVVAGVVALVQTRRRDQRGVGLAIGGLVAAGLWAVFIALATLGFLLDSKSTYEALGRVGDAGSAKVGACLSEPNVGGSFAPVVVCSADHWAEVFEVAQLGEAPWPGYEEVDRRADETCFDNYASYLGTNYDDSAFDYGFFAPDEAEWRSGERRVVCVVLPYDEDLPRHTVRDSE